MKHFSLASVISSIGYEDLPIIYRDPLYITSYLTANIYIEDCALFRNCLYIVEGNRVPEPLQNGLYGCILIPSRDCETVEGPYAYETVIWPESISSAKLLNKVQNIFLAQTSTAQMARMLMSSLSLSSSIGSIIHQAAEIMQNAILLLDPAYRVIAMEGLGCDIKDIFWQDCLENHRVSDENVQIVKKAGLTQALESSQSVQIWKNAEVFNKIPRLAQKIYSKEGVYLGTIAVFQAKHSFTKDDYYLLDSLTETLSGVLTHYDSLSEKQKNEADMLRHLLNSANTSELTAAERKVYDKLSEYSFYQLGYIPLSDNAATSRLGLYIRAVLLGELDGVISAVYQKNVFIIIYVEDNKDRYAVIESLKMKLQPLGLRVGLSNVFSSLDMIREQQALAVHAASMASFLSQQPTILPFNYVSCLELLHTIPAATLEQYLSTAAIAPLFSPKSTDLYKTLKSFILHLGSYTETAQELFIHKNTLLYRLSKIQAITGIDYTSSEELLSASLSLCVHEFLKQQQ